MSNIALVGKGNLGTHLAARLEENHEVEVFTRPEGFAKTLESHDISIFDFVFFCVPDDQIGILSRSLKSAENTIFIHSSGTKSLSEIGQDNRAVIYPLQSFSKNREVKMSTVPLYLETEDKLKLKIEKLAKSISPVVKWADSKKRLQLHLAAVFANNFSNHLLSISNALLSESSIEFSDLRPLMIETIEKAFDLSPANAQTGPAIRNDHKTIERHLDLIPSEAWRDIYQLITKDIRNSSK